MAFSKFDPIWSNMILFSEHPYIFKNMLFQNDFVKIWSNLIQFDPIWSTLIQFDPIWSNLIQFGPIWPSVIQFDPTSPQKMQICNFLTKGLTRTTRTRTTNLCLGLREQSLQSKIAWWMFFKISKFSWPIRGQHVNFGLVFFEHVC